MQKYRLLAVLTVLTMLLGVLPLGAAAPISDPGPSVPGLSQVNVAGSFESEIGGNDWSNNDALTNLADANSDGVWKFGATIPVAGSYAYKIVEDGDWSKAFPAGDVPLTVTDGQTVNWYYDPVDHYVADSVNQVIAAAVGNFPSKIGGADWAPDNLRTLLKGPDSEGKYTYTAKGLPAGSYEYKIALNESWAVSYPSANKAFTVPAGGGDVKFTFDPATNAVSEEVLPPSGGLITIDGVKDAAYGSAVATDPVADMSEPNLDLNNLYIVDDANNYYIGLDAGATNWGMTYGIYIDTNQVDGSGATTDPWGRAVNAVSIRLPEYALYVYHKDDGALESAQLTTWDGTAWQYPTLVSKGGAQGFSAANHFLEYSIPKAALGSPAHIAIEAFTTGGSGHAQDSVPPDVNVNFAAPDWGGATTTLSNFVIYPAIELLVTFPGSYPEASGLGGNWAPDNLNTKGADPNGDSVYTFATTAIPAGSYEFKATVGGSWAENYGVDGVPGGANLTFTAAGGGQEVKFYYDRSDNWVANNAADRIVTLVGSLGEALGGANWAPDNLTTWMKDKAHDGWYTFAGFLPAGSYEYKVAVGESWAENYGQGGAAGGANIPLVVPEPGQTVTFKFNYATKEIQDSINNPAEPGIDGNIWWDGLRHDSRDALYRTPFGAVTKGSEVRLRFRTTAGDVEGVSVRVTDLLSGGASLYRMNKAATVPGDDENPWGYDFWEVTFNAPDKLTVLGYTFGAVDGDKIVYYEDDAAQDGGVGQPYNAPANRPYNIYVYDAAFTSPEWAKNAVIYQIFPDRFRNGDATNDPTADKWFYPAERGHAWPITPWNTIVPDPEPYDVSNPWYSTYSSTFYGGDLQGVIDKLDYLQSFGVNTIYFNPIFLSPSNHRYDGSDYRTIDPSLGDLALFRQLDAETEARGMKIVLDMVPNHVSSDSIYFDRFGRYPEVGACESVDSPYRSWFYFTPANPAGTGVCAGDTNYEAWYGVVTLPKVNTTDNDAVRNFWMRDADATAKYWLNNGADGYRVDVVPDIAGSFFTEWRPILQSTKSDVMTYSETWGESDVRPVVLGDKFDSTMNYRFATTLLSFLRDTPFSDGDGNLNLTPLTPSEFEAAIRAIQEDYPEPAWSTAMNLLDSHDTNRAVVKLDHDGIAGSGADRYPVNDFIDGKARLKTVAILQYTLPGAPTIYYGDEVGLAGFGSDVPRDDPYNRQPYPWADEDGYGALPAWRQADASLLAHYQAMGQIRGQYSFLRTGSFDTLLADDEINALAYGRKDGTGVGLVLINRAATAQTITFKVGGYLPNGLTFTDALNGGNYTVTSGMLAVPVNGLWGAVLVHEGAVTPPAAPTTLKATEGESQVLLTWSAVSGATSYKVFRSYLSGGGYEKIAEVTGTSYVDTDVENGQIYYYVVRAVKDGLDSADSNEVSAIPHWTISGLLLQWPPSITHVIQAGQATETIYARVFVKNETLKPGPIDGVLMQIGYGPADVLPGDWDTWQPMTYSKDYGTTDWRLKEWEEWMGALMPDQVGRYTYLVRASATGGREWLYGGFHSGLSDGGILNVVPSDDTTPPAAPLNLVLKGTTPASITLGWDASTEPDLYGYELYRRQVDPVPADPGWSRLATILAGATQYIDREVSSDVTYEYYLIAVDTSYNRSAHSNTVIATAEARMVSVTWNVTIPAFTPAADVVYMPGNQAALGTWTANKPAMTKVDDTHWTLTMDFLDGTAIEYKYTRGSWDTVEWWEEIHDLINRSLTVDYGTDGTQVVNDTVPNWRDPLVISSDPADQAVDVPTNAVLKVVFSRPIVDTTLADRVTLETGGVSVAGTVTYDAALNTVTFTPAAALKYSTTYVLTLSTGIMSDANSSLQNPYVVTFTTEPGRVVAVTWNVTVPPETPAADVVYMPGNLAVLGSWTANQPAMTKVDATHWTLTVDLEEGTAVEYKYTRGSWDTVEWWEQIHDQISRTLTVSYGTVGTQVVNDTVPTWRDPLVISSAPADQAVNVPTNAALKVVFSRPIMEATLAGRVTLETGGVSVAGTVTYDAALNTVTFTPAAALRPSTTYTLTLSTGIMSDANASLQHPFVVTFTTGLFRIFLPIIFG